MIEFWGAILDVVVGGPRAWSRPDRIAEASGLTIETITTCLGELDASGMTEEWPGHGWTLTPLGASILNVCLAEHPISGELAWWTEPPRPRRHKSRYEQITLCNEPTDPQPGPAELAEAGDLWDRDQADQDQAARSWKPRRPWAIENLPRPALFLTGGPTTWRERPGLVAGKRKRGKQPGPYRCDGCNGRPLKSNAYCGRCDRWGLDHLVATKRYQAWVSCQNMAR